MSKRQIVALISGWVTLRSTEKQLALEDFCPQFRVDPDIGMGHRQVFNS